MRHSLHAALVALSASALAAFWGCSATEKPTEETASGTGASALASSSSSGQGGEPDLDAGDKDGGPIDEDAACAKSSAKAKLLPLDLVLLLDRSGSMITDDKWGGVTLAIKGFIADPASDGIGVGLGFFPEDPDVDTCDYKDYDVPKVPVGELPANLGPLTSVINTTNPGGNTPMWSALKGTLLYAGAWHDAHPKHKVVVVLASDGQPGSCGAEHNKVTVIAEMVKSARDYSGVDTYAIGIAGSDIPSLDLIAAAGGTVEAYDVTADISLFAAKMKEIRLHAVACEYLLPTPPDGEELDIGAVNVDYLPGDASMPELLPQADSKVDCGAKPGWYYDDPVHPTAVLLCPASCDTVQMDGKAEIKVLFGCKTQVN